MKPYQFVAPFAHLIGMAAGNVSALRWTGIAPYRTRSADPYIVEVWEKPEPFTQPPPPSLDPKATWEKFPEDPIKHHYLAELENGIAFSHGIVPSADGHHIPGVSHKMDTKVRRRRKQKLFGTPVAPFRPLPQIQTIDGPVIVATSTNQRFYFHWMMDILPRLLRVREGPYADVPVYVEASRPFQQQTLALLGIDPNRIIDASKTSLLTGERLVVPCYQAALGCSIPDWIIDGLRDLLPADALSGDMDKRIYLSRSDAPHRRMANEQAVVGRLERYGFETVRLSELTFVDQARLFARASHIIGPHGGALTNLLFCQPGAKVLELFPHITQDPYYRISHARGLSYSFLKPPGKANDDSWEGLADHDVDLPLLEDYLESL